MNKLSRPWKSLVLSTLAVIALGACASQRGGGMGDRQGDKSYTLEETGNLSYTKLPPGYSGSAYYVDDLYYTGGTYETGNYQNNGRTYSNRYYHSGRYFYGGTFKVYTGQY